MTVDVGISDHDENDGDHAPQPYHFKASREGTESILPDSEVDPYVASPASRYTRYDLRVDSRQNDRATEIKIFSWKRPHSRAMHCAWISFFLAFMIWFAVAPLLVEIQNTLGITKEQVWTSSICSDLTTIFMRFFIGPLCDRYGSRIPMGVVLIVASIPTAMVGLVNSAAGLAVIRLFMGIAGSTFVMAQHWPTCMYTNETAGTANGIVGGWGNLGGAFTQVMMGSVLFPALTSAYGGNTEKAWRTVCVFPAIVAFIWGFIVIKKNFRRLATGLLSRDEKKGNHGQQLLQLHYNALVLHHPNFWISQPQHVDTMLAVCVLLWRRAHHEQRRSPLLHRSVWAKHTKCGSRGVYLRMDEHICAWYGRPLQ
mmetsp:Transcript_31619/g.58282  ORF Transcript_31619/g.58282 Transcript_31619/m.58282 type:complete len:368 (+) Transcript_31619:128-1231(+)